MDSMEQNNYQGIKAAIKNELNRVAESFVAIGYQLKQVRDRELYKIDGYNNINEFAKAEYSLSQSTTSRFIAINDAFSMEGSSPKLLEQYEGYGYSKLSEMLTLSEDEMKLVTIRTTRAEIREIKQVKKEVEAVNYAPAHKSESTENTQSEVTFCQNKTFLLPEADKLLIEFFREKTRRSILKELAAVLSGEMNNENIVKAAELINPSGHLMYRKGFIILIFEEDHIKYSKFNGITAQYSYSDFIHDIYLVFDMDETDPWVAFYGEPEPEQVPEPDPEPIPQPKKKEPEKKEQQKPAEKVPDKRVEKPAATQSIEEKKEAQVIENNVKTIADDNIPGQIDINEYPEYLSPSEEQNNENGTLEIVEAEIVHSQDKAEDVKVTFDEETGEVEVYIRKNSGVKSIHIIDTDTGESWEVTLEK